MSVAAKQDFLDRLKASISCLPLQDQADILNDYEEHFRIGLENGKTEAEIAGSLGSPEELGASFVEENAQPVPAQEEIFSHSQTAPTPAPDSPQAATWRQSGGRPTTAGAITALQNPAPCSSPTQAPPTTCSAMPWSRPKRPEPVKPRWHPAEITWSVWEVLISQEKA